MERWKRFLDKVFALVTSPGFEDLDPAEQDRLYERIARAARAERLLESARPPSRFLTRAKPGSICANFVPNGDENGR